MYWLIFGIGLLVFGYHWDKKTSADIDARVAEELKNKPKRMNKIPILYVFPGEAIDKVMRAAFIVAVLINLTLGLLG